jgi:hypothetical protein
LLENCLSLRFRSWAISAAWITRRARTNTQIFFHSNLFVRGAFEQNPQERTLVWGSHTRENTAGGHYFHGRSERTLCENIRSPKKSDPSNAAFCHESREREFHACINQTLKLFHTKEFSPFPLVSAGVFFGSGSGGGGAA